MYLPAVFLESNAPTIDAFVDDHRLATVILVVDGQAHVDHLPFVRLTTLQQGSRLVAHVSKSNSTWKHAGEGATAVLVFSGASAYISPSLYPSKKQTGEVVPTWNYASVHVRGRLRCEHDRDQKHRIVTALTDIMESHRDHPWAITDAPDAYIEKMLAGVVALEFEVTSLEAKFKASQNRTTEDRLGVVAGLGEDPLTHEAGLLVSKKLQQS